MSTVVVTLDPTDNGAELGRQLGGSPGFQSHKNPNALWAYRGEGVVVCLYKSGKCVVQGAGAASFAESYLPASESSLEGLDSDLIGTDESGKGDYFGPLVAAAVLIPKGQERVLAELGVKDCKQMSDRAATEAAESIRAGYPHEIVAIGPERYNEMYEGFGNLNLLLAWATVQAIEKVVETHPCENALSDKFANERTLLKEINRRGIEINLTQKVRAESNPAVAAASVVARDAFLRGLGRLSREAGQKLPKGAGAPVLPVARRIYQDGGMEALGKVAKLHFKTTNQITGELF